MNGTHLSDKAAHWLSHLLNPPAAAAWTLTVLVWKSRGGADGALTLLSVAMVWTTALPCLLFLWLARAGWIGDLYISEQDQRHGPYAVMICCYAAGALSVAWLNAPWVVIGLMIAYTVSTAAVTAINFFWKVSHHTTIVATSAYALAQAHRKTAVVSGLALLLISWARLRTKSHERYQVALGALVGIGLTFVVFAILEYVG